MRAYLLLILISLLPQVAIPQKLTDGIYWVRLTDKTGNGYSLTDPSEFLSQRALERRAKQKIALTDEDLPLSKIYLDSLENMGLKILGTSRWFNAVIVESNNTSLLENLSTLKFISEFNFESYGKKVSRINGINKKSISFTEKTTENYSYDYGLALPQIAILNGDHLHNAGYRGEGVHIAVIDGGFYGADTLAAFDSLWAEGRLLGYKDFSRSATSFFSTSSHGMSVLSTMAANIPGKIVGTAPKASYWLMKSEIVESESRYEEALWVLAAEFADSAGVDIINSSLGYSEFDDPVANYSYSDMDGKTSLITRAAEKAFSKGMIVVSSAGNEGNKPWRYITAPADGPNVLTIGATDTSGVLAAFSSVGPTASMVVKPDVLAVGLRSIVVNSSGNAAEGSGTSFSSPQIAGLTACLWQASPEKTNIEIINSIRRSSSLYFNPNNTEGYGIPDFQTALFLLKKPSSGSRAIIVPNPNTGIFEFRFDTISEGAAKISIYDSMGKSVFSGNKDFSFGYIKIDELQNHKTGVYFITVKTKETEYFSKVIIL